MEKITQFLKEVLAEAKNITWPTRKQSVLATVVVIIISLLVAYYLGLLDNVFSRILGFLLINY